MMKGKLMEYLIKAESEITAAGTKKSYDICEKDRHERSYPKLHTHSYYEILLVTEGELMYQIELNSGIKLCVGDVIFVPSYIPHATYASLDPHIRGIIVKFSPLMLYPVEVTQSDINYLLATPVYKEPYYVFRNGETLTNELAPTLRRILKEFTELAPGYEISLRGELSLLYTWLIRNCSNDASDQQSDLKFDEYSSQKLHTVLQYLNNNYQYNISMQEVAEMCNMHYKQFSRFFKKITGKNFSEYLLDMRLNYAQKMLLKGEDSISEVASKCGFDYVSYFIRKFKEKYDVTPKEYQKMYKSIPQKNEVNQ